METKTRKRRKAFIDKACVACGCCLKVCPKQALEIWKGITAKVDLEKCVGCGICAASCPKKCLTLK